MFPKATRLAKKAMAATIAALERRMAIMVGKNVPKDMWQRSPYQANTFLMTLQHLCGFIDGPFEAADMLKMSLVMRLPHPWF